MSYYLFGTFTNYVQAGSPTVKNAKVILDNYLDLDGNSKQVYCKAFDASGTEVAYIPLIVSVKGNDINEIAKAALNQFKINMIANDLELLSE